MLSEYADSVSGKSAHDFNMGFYALKIPEIGMHCTI